jgi:hypothetical protein
MKIGQRKVKPSYMGAIVPSVTRGRESTQRRKKGEMVNGTGALKIIKKALTYAKRLGRKVRDCGFCHPKQEL